MHISSLVLTIVIATGLGKTIQAIAALSMYHEEWPVVVLSPSGARYHWQNEFVNWLGEAKQDIPLLEFDDNRGKVEFEPDEGQDEEVCSGEPKPPMKPLLHSDVNVLTSGSDSIFPAPETKVVIISYGLAPKLVEDQIIRPGMFQCAIVDESHMLKNKSSKRTKLLLPVLRATKRCVLLSGTPALARPIELWPQMRILGTHEDEWLTNEDEFVRKYVKGGGQQARAELHTLLTGSVMIRRMKADILKQLPSKMREQGLVHVLDNAGREEFRKFLTALRQGKGALANLAFKSKEVGEEETSYAQERSQAQECTQLQESTKNQQPRSISHEEIAQKVNEEIQAYFDQKNAAIEHMFALQAASGQYTAQQLQMIKLQAQNALRSDIGVLYHQRTAELKRENAAITSTPQSSQQDNSGEQPSRKSLLIQMYKKTGQVKIPLVARMLREWINDPAKGKLCIFAHHISVLNEIGRLAGLSNSEGSKSNFIRIDGSTNPRQRQEQINTFQNNPAFRIALLGITAAGVAVTLTASSTVWFAELFWTPALLIQAEDRCHRIGQQARVRCLYIVAKGTLDEILWKHVEKKFRDLGEFVEGKEKMKIVVHKTYKNEKELLKSLEADEFDLDDEEYFDDDAEMKSAEKLESELHDDIEELEREELEMLKSTESDDDDAEGDSKPTAAETVDLSSEPAEVAGTSASEAICLSDDEDQQNAHKSLKEEGLKFDREFRDLKLYKMRFPGPSAGLDIIQFKGRVVVKGKKNAKLGPDSKPSIGDVVVACKDDEIVPDVKLGSLLMYFRNLMKSDGYLEFIFAEDEEFGAYFREKLESPDFMKELKNDEEENNSSKSSHDGQHNGSRRVRGLQTYHLTFQSQDEYGFGIDTLDDVLAVTTIFPSRVRKIGADSSPQVGDALVGINGTPLPARISAEQVRTALNALKRQGKTVELMFAAADMSLKSFVKEFLDQRQAVQLAERQASSTAAASRQKSADDEPEVIDLLDE
jgi:SWI/SNF-related matrix-associated actin-dependent regulator 1 of chromatin subfamily A